MKSSSLFLIVLLSIYLVIGKDTLFSSLYVHNILVYYFNNHPYIDVILCNIFNCYILKHVMSFKF